MLCCWHATAVVVAVVGAVAAGLKHATAVAVADVVPACGWCLPGGTGHIHNWPDVVLHAFASKLHALQQHPDAKFGHLTMMRIAAKQQQAHSRSAPSRFLQILFWLPPILFARACHQPLACCLLSLGGQLDLESHTPSNLGHLPKPYANLPYNCQPAIFDPVSPLANPR